MELDPPWLNAITAAVVAVFTMCKATIELRRWRTERRAVKQAEVAGEALSTALRLLAAVRANTNAALTRSDALGDADQDVHVRFRKAIAARWENVKPALDRFLDAWNKAEPYVSDDASKVFEEISKLQESIAWAQLTHTEAPPGRAPAELFTEGFGAAPQTEIDRLRADARRLLRPYAQFMKPRTT